MLLDFTRDSKCFTKFSHGGCGGENRAKFGLGLKNCKGRKERRMSGNPYAHYDNQGVPGGVAGAAGTSAYPDSGRPAASPTAASGAGRGNLHGREDTQFFWVFFFSLFMIV